MKDRKRETERKDFFVCVCVCVWLLTLRIYVCQACKSLSVCVCVCVCVCVYVCDVTLHGRVLLIQHADGLASDGEQNLQICLHFIAVETGTFPVYCGTWVVLCDL